MNILKRLIADKLVVLLLIGIISCQNKEATAPTAVPDEASEIEVIKSKYNTDIPGKILTPDLENTSIGALNYTDGVPTAETAEMLYDNLDFIRGVETFLNGIPATSLEGIHHGMNDVGATKFNQVVLFDGLMDSNPLWLTGNTSTIYASAILDLREGPMVVEVPAGSGPGTVNDAFFRFVVDMGFPGPDRGKGGKYLILPPDYKKEMPEGYFAATSTSYINWLILRGFLVDGKTDFSVKMYKEGLKIYPLKDSENAPEMEFISGSKKDYNTIHANDFNFYKELNEVIQREPVSFLDPELRGLFASIGIEKGKTFAPSERTKKILEDAVKVGNATARAIVFNTREDDAILFKDHHWESGFLGGDYRWLKNNGKGGRYLDARTRFFYAATVNTPAMVLKMIGKGSQYAIAFRDSEGTGLDGNKSYTLTIPADAPAKDFWSLVVYDPQTRSELQTTQSLPSISSKRTPLVANEDGSHTIYFGQKNTAPKGKEANWLQTVPDKGWFVVLRLYGPLEPWFDKTWIPGNIELVEK